MHSSVLFWIATALVIVGQVMILRSTVRAIRGSPSASARRAIEWAYAVVPVILLVVVSLLTPPTDPTRVARFYVRLKTPVAATLAQDALDVEQSYAQPGRFDHRKLWPKSNWELTKWDRQDTLGFLGCCGLVGFILVFFKAVLTIGG